MGVNIIIILLAYMLQMNNMNINFIMLIIFIIAAILSQIPYLLLKYKKRELIMSEELLNNNE